MTNFRFLKWCRDAVSRIVLPQDRVAVEVELMGHMEDRYDSLIRSGHSDETAQMLTLESMGDSSVIARELGLIHRPFWGRTAKVTRILLIAALCLTLFSAGASYLKNFYFRPAFSTPTYGSYNPYSDTQAFLHNGTARQEFYTAPGSSFTADGYRVTLTQAALWTGTLQSSTGSVTEETSFHMQLQVINLLIWADSDDISRWLWAEDDLGNRYAPTYESAPDTRSVRVKTYRTNPWTTIHELQLEDFVSDEAQWIDLHYDRSGRDLTLRVDLTGGK